MKWLDHLEEWLIASFMGTRFVWENGAHFAFHHAFHLDMTDLIEGPTTPGREWPTWVMYLAIPLGSSLMCLRFLQVARNFTRTGELPHHDHGHVDGLDDEEAKDGHHRADRGRVAMAADHAGLPGPGDLLAEDVAVVAASADEVTQRALFMRLTSAYR